MAGKLKDFGFQLFILTISAFALALGGICSSRWASSSGTGTYRYIFDAGLFDMCYTQYSLDSGSTGSQLSRACHVFTSDCHVSFDGIPGITCVGDQSPCDFTRPECDRMRAVQSFAIIGTFFLALCVFWAINAWRLWWPGLSGFGWIALTFWILAISSGAITLGLYIQYTKEHAAVYGAVNDPEARNLGQSFYAYFGGNMFALLVFVSILKHFREERRNPPPSSTAVNLASPADNKL